jgi:peptide/nickel transport system substrate-binding protein
MSDWKLSRRAALASSAAVALSSAVARRVRGASLHHFVTGSNAAFDTMDPHAVFDIGRIAIRLNMYDSLVRWVGNPPELAMWLAEKLDVAPNGLSYTFALRSGARFHDGTPVTAADVVYSMERILAMKRGAYTLFKSAIAPGSTKALDDRTVQFNLAMADAVLPAKLSELWVVNSHVLRQHEASGDWAAAWLSRNEAGSGGYHLRRFDPAIGFQVDRFPDHFMGWHPGAIDVAEFRLVRETASRVLSLINGELNTTDGYLPADQIKRIRESGRVNIIEQESLRTFYCIINNSKPPLDDVNLRKALSYAFDYDGFNKDILADSVVRNPGIIPNPMWGAPKDLQGYSYDLAKAKEHLAQVKGPLRTLQVAVLAGFPQSEQAGQLLKAGGDKIGLDIRVVSEPSFLIQSELANPNGPHDIVPIWQSAYFADPDNWTGVLYNSRAWGGTNKSFYKNPKVDELTDKALTLTDKEQRRPLYEEVSRILVDDAAGIFINNSKYYGAFTKNVQSIRFCPIGDAQDLRWIVMS